MVSRVAPLETVKSKLLAIEPPDARARVPAAIVVGPVNVFEAASVAMAGPVLVNPPAPEITPLHCTGSFAPNVNKLPALLSEAASVRVPLELVIVVGLLSVEGTAH